MPAAKARLAARRPLVDAFLKHHVRFWTEDRALFGWSPEEMIETIRADGAIDVVAHPNRVRDTARMAKVLELAQGVEVYTSRHSETIAARFLDYASTHRKLWTASTDDHQHFRQLPYRKPPSGTPSGAAPTPWPSVPPRRPPWRRPPPTGPWRSRPGSTGPIWSWTSAWRTRGAATG